MAFGFYAAKVRLFPIACKRNVKTKERFLQQQAIEVMEDSKRRAKAMNEARIIDAGNI